MSSPSRRPTAILYCLLRHGAGHWVRTATIAEALAGSFDVVLAASGDLSSDLWIPEGIDVVPMPTPPEGFLGEPPASGSGLGAALAGLIARTLADVLLTESFPFGRQNLLIEMTRCLVPVRASPNPPLVVSSARDIDQRKLPGQDWLDRTACDTANRYFDAILVHTDPAIAPFAETFPLADRLRPAVVETGYVTRGLVPRRSGTRDPVIVVSTGGGRSGESLVLTAANAWRQSDLSADLTMRIFAGTYTSARCWAELQTIAAGTRGLEVHRWSADLRGELGRAACSVSRCGYNTALDVLASGVPALVVPFATPAEDEQTRRAGRLAELNLVRTVAEDGLTPARLAAEIRHTLEWTPSVRPIDFNGAQRTAEWLRARVAERRSAG